MSTANVRRHLHETRKRPAGINNRSDVKRDRLLLRVKRWIGGTLLAPACLVTAITLSVMLWRAMTRLDFLHSEEFIFFSFGLRCFHFFKYFFSVRYVMVSSNLSHHAK